jgi:hypothetical protein
MTILQYRLYLLIYLYTVTLTTRKILMYVEVKKDIQCILYTFITG